MGSRAAVGPQRAESGDARSGRGYPAGAGLPLAVVSHRDTVGGPADHVAFAGWHEAEDVLLDTSGSELVSLRYHARRPVMRARRGLGRGLRMVAGRNRLLPPDWPVGPGGRRPPGRAGGTSAGYHVLMMGHSAWDVGLLERLRLARRRATTVSLWLPESWPSTLEHRLMPFEPFTLVDHLFVGVPEAVDRHRELAPNADVHVLPPATDVVRFAGQGPDGARPIAVLGIGRRHERQHEDLLRWSAGADRLYLFDSVMGPAVDWVAHREQLARLYQQSHISLCNYAKHDQPTVVGSVRTVPMRLYEGLASGTLLVGLAPGTDAQRALVGAEVVEPFSDVAGRLNPLFDTPPDAPGVTALRRRNQALALRAHDWGHRWEVVLRALGLPVPELLAQRLDELSRRADRLDRGLSRTAGPGAATPGPGRSTTGRVGP